MSHAPVIRILLVDDHYVVRFGLATLLEKEADLQVVAQGEDGAQALAAFRTHRPDVTLMDMRMPGMNGVEATRAIRAEFSAARIVMLTTYDGDEDIFRALEAGAQGYLLKDATADELLNAIRCVYAGGQYVPKAIAARLAERDPASQLTARELEVLELVTKGLSNREIGAVLGCSENTAKWHLKNILLKLDVTDRTEATRAAVQRGILHVD